MKRNVYRKLESLAKDITGKTVVFESKRWHQRDGEIVIPPFDFEGLLHELCHWLVATPHERNSPNLMLVDGPRYIIVENGEDRYSTRRDARRSIRREKQACLLQMLILQEADLEVGEFMESQTIGGLQYGQMWWDRLSDKQRQMRLYHVRKRTDDAIVSKLVDITQEFGRYI